MTTRLGPLNTIAASSDPFGLANYDQLKANNDYLTVAGADLASATTIDITSGFHGVTGTVTIANITDLLGAVEGQQVRLWIKAGPLAIQNNGGGTGNVRTQSGSDQKYVQNQVVTLVFDGALWREQSTYAMPPYILSPFVGAATTSTLVANTAYLVPVSVPVPFLTTKFGLHIGIQSGNIDVGCYDVNLNKLVTLGSTACPAAGHDVLTLGATVIPPGTAYLALAANNATATIGVSSTAAAAGLTGLVLNKATSFPLPSSLAGATDASAIGINPTIGIFQ